jgi:hypoxanthine phosphoribosyltransferase
VQSYDYANRAGVRELSWDDCADLAHRIAEELAARDIELIIGVARAGLFPATTVAMALRREFYPVRLSRRIDDEVRFDVPVWRVPVTADVAGRRVAVVDEIADTGQSLDLVKRAVLDAGARRVTTACLVSHSWSDPAPDVAATASDELIIFPWGRQVYVDGAWRLNPELEAALRHQNR